MNNSEVEMPDHAERLHTVYSVSEPSQISDQTITKTNRSPNRAHDRQYFYKYMTASVAKIVLSKQTLRWSSPVIFNDPFDITSELHFHFNEEELTRALAIEIANMIEQGSTSAGHPAMHALLSISAKFDQASRSALAASLRDNPPSVTQGQVSSMELLRETWRKIVPTQRILCFSERNDVTSMWNHYADKYRGVVIEFEAVDEIDSALLQARRVEYRASPPRVASLNEWVVCLISNDVRRFIELFTEYEYTKTNDWSYEQEWRIVSGMRKGESGYYSDYPFHPCELSSIYLGPMISPKDCEDILALLRSRGDCRRVYETTIDPRAGRFRFVQISLAK